MKHFILSVGMFLFFCPALHAAEVESTYIGLQYSEFRDLDDSDALAPSALIGRVGHFYTENLVLEGRFGIGLMDDDMTSAGITVTSDIDNLLGLYGLFQVDIADFGSIYALAGYTQLKIKASAANAVTSVSANETEDYISVGFGANIGQLNLEYLVFDDADVDSGFISIGIIDYFD